MMNKNMINNNIITITNINILGLTGCMLCSGALIFSNKLIT